MLLSTKRCFPPGKLFGPITAGPAMTPHRPPRKAPGPLPALQPLTQLTARVPHLLGAVVGRVHPKPQWVDTGQLPGIVPDKAVTWWGVRWFCDKLLGYPSPGIRGCNPNPGTGWELAGFPFPLPLPQLPFSLTQWVWEPHEEVTEVQGRAGTAPTALHCTPAPNPHVPDSAHGTPGPRLTSCVS